MKTANPYLNFPGNTEEAFTYYKSVFGGEFVDFLRFKDFGGDEMGVPEKDRDKIAHVALPLGENNLLMGTDVVDESVSVTFGNNFYVTVETDSGDEADRLFSRLADGGKIEMPLEQTSWAEKYGACSDKFGVQWMVMYTGNVQFNGSPEG